MAIYIHGYRTKDLLQYLIPLFLYKTCLLYSIVYHCLNTIQLNFGWVPLCVVACIIIRKDFNVLQMVKLNFVFLTFMNINCRITEKFSESIYLPDRLA